MSTGTVGQIVEYKNGSTDGRYILEDDRTCKAAQLTAIRIERLVEEYASEYQHIAVYETAYHGKMLVLDGIVQMTTNDEFCYHEMIVHVPATVIRHEPRTALVVGGGDGGVVNQLCKIASLERIVWIDIDSDVVRICEQHFPELHEHHDRRVEFIAMDGAEIEFDREFDLVIVDGTDPLEDKASLWSQRFYSRLSRAVKADGVATALAGWAWPEPDMYLAIRDLSGAHFDHSQYYWFLDPSMRYGYTGVFLMTNSNIDPSVPAHPHRVPQELMRFYNPGIHSAAFVLPTCFTSGVPFAPGGPE
jgi:spermidine synthase